MVTPSHSVEYMHLAACRLSAMIFDGREQVKLAVPEHITRPFQNDEVPDINCPIIKGSHTSPSPPILFFLTRTLHWTDDLPC